MEYYTEVRNNTLYVALEKFIRKGIGELKGIIDAFDTSRKQSEQDRDRRIFVASIPIDSHFSIVKYLINGQKSRLTSLEEYRKCVQVMDSDGIIHAQLNRYFTLNSMNQFLGHWNYILHILAKMVDSNTETFNEQLFTKLYLDLENFFFGNSIEVHQMSILNNFKMAEDTPDIIALSEGLSIRRITQKELEMLGQSSFHYANSKNLFILEHKQEIKKGFGVQSQSVDILRIFSSVIYALRLFREGDVGINHIYTKLPLDVPIIHTKLDVTGLDLNTHYGSYYRLKKDDIDNLCDFWQSYSSILYNVSDSIRSPNDELNVIKISMERFNLSYSEKTPESKFVDIIISLEALFTLPRDPNDSLTYRLALRVSKFLEGNRGKREELFRDFKELYGIRSRIVHSGHGTIKFGKVEGIMKRSMLLMLDKAKEQNYNHENVINSIDFD